MRSIRFRETIIILILGALATISPLSIDMYLPAFSQIAKDFKATPALISFSVTSYFIGLAIGQLFYGPLLDRFGRKKPLYFGLFVYIIASVGCIGSKSIEALVIFRFIQAIGGCVAIVASTTMVRDFFPLEKTAKIFSFLTLILGISPLLAPTIGSYILKWLGWHWIFIILMIIVLLIISIVFFYLPKGQKTDTKISLKLKPMLSNYILIFKNPQFYTFTFSGAFSFAILFIYVAGSPIIFLDTLKISPQTYGGIFALLSIGFIGGNQLNILLLRKFKSKQIFRFALLCQPLIATAFLLGVLNNWYALKGTVVMFFLLLSFLGLIYPNASALALAPFTNHIGSASALMGFLQTGVAALAASSIGIFNSNDIIPIIVILLTTSVIAFLIFFIGGKKFIQSGNNS